MGQASAVALRFAFERIHSTPNLLLGLIVKKHEPLKAVPAHLYNKRTGPIFSRFCMSNNQILLGVTICKEYMYGKKFLHYINFLERVASIFKAVTVCPPEGWGLGCATSVFDRVGGKSFVGQSRG